MDTHARVAPGLRRLAPQSLPIKVQAHGFAGLPGGVSIGQLLAAFKRAAAPLGLAGVRDLLDQLHAFSQAQDWKPDSRPIVWPSNAALAERLGVSDRHVRRMLGRLIEGGIIIPVDSPQGRRWGRRDETGRLVEAYGFDLSPLALRYEEFLAIAATAEAERRARHALRRRLTIARKAIQQLAETAIEHDLGSPTGAGERSAEPASDWRAWLAAAHGLAVSAAGEIASLEVLEGAVRGLEERRAAVEAQLVTVLKRLNESGSADIQVRHITTTTEPRADSATCKMAFKEGGNGPGKGDRTPGDGIVPDEPPAATPRFVLRVSPAIRDYVASPNPTWSDVVNAADQLRHQLGISRPAWIEACEVLGRYQAATAVAIIGAKRDTIRSPGGYLRGMVARGREGSLYLLRSLYGLAETPRHPIRAEVPIRFTGERSAAKGGARQYPGQSDSERADW